MRPTSFATDGRGRSPRPRDSVPKAGALLAFSCQIPRPPLKPAVRLTPEPGSATPLEPRPFLPHRQRSEVHQHWPAALRGGYHQVSMARELLAELLGHLVQDQQHRRGPATGQRHAQSWWWFVLATPM